MKILDATTTMKPSAELVDEEVVLACEDRGMDVLDRPVGDLREALAEWLRETAPRAGDSGGAREEAEEKVWRRFLVLEEGA